MFGPFNRAVQFAGFQPPLPLQDHPRKFVWLSKLTDPPTVPGAHKLLVGIVECQVFAAIQHDAF